MVLAAPAASIALPDRELACALANRHILTHLARQAFAEVLPGVQLPLLYDVSHNTCREKTHTMDGRKRRLFVHRKGTASYILAGAAAAGRNTGERAFGSACHGAGRAMSRHEAARLAPLICIKG